MGKSFLLLLIVVSIFYSCAKSQEYTGFKVSGRHLYDNCGEMVILRGISNPNIWFERTGNTHFKEIEKTGANVVRIVWQSNGSPSDLDKAITNCIDLNMIPMIELHDATGDWSKLQQCVNYWLRDDVVDVIRKHESYLLVNIANEAGDYNVTGSTFKNTYINAITSLRNAGIRVPLIIDATDWGKNINILQSQGPAIVEADPEHNVMFSIHMWWPKMYGYTEQSIVNEIQESVKMGLPLIVGEFSQMHGECNDNFINDNNSIAYKTIIRECQKNQVGYIAWSWFGNCNSLWDMSTSGTFESLYDWGLEVAVTDENSIKNTSVRPYSIVNGKCNPQSSDAKVFKDTKVASLNINPNYSTKEFNINFSLDKEQKVELCIFNSQGKKVYTLINSLQKKGYHAFIYNALELPAGIYFCRLSAHGFNETLKMVVLK
ncbi:MAG: T9SS type A sorting domain-containing protein [Prolixibacteraceae bacterium]|nr:T9SS type A sorting domain-containing protein [Prolixibacteraceae bacterium]